MRKNALSTTTSTAAKKETVNGLSISEIRKVVAEQLNGYGMNNQMSIMKLVGLLGNAIASRKEEYDLTFVKEDGIWYIDMPNWPWKRENLAMVCGADKMLDILAMSPENDKGENKVRVLARPQNSPEEPNELQSMMEDNWVELTQIDSSLTGGAHFTAKGKAFKDFLMKDYRSGGMKPRTIWLCPVTLFVFGQYPVHIYGKVLQGQRD